MLIADDHRLFRDGLRQILEMVGEFQVVGEAENGQAAVELVDRLKPDVVLMDVSMPVLDGVEATRSIAANHPEVRVIILTMYRQDRFIFDAICAGARGYLLKDIGGRELIAAVQAVCRGEALIDPTIAARILAEFRHLNDSTLDVRDVERLTAGEMQVLQLVAQGEDNRTIGQRLGLAERTVANRLRDVFQKLHVNNRTQAALIALRRGWAKLDGGEGDASPGA